MAEFSSVHSYDRFASSVARQWRYFLREHEPFLSAVRETCRSRGEALPKGAMLWRAQEGAAERTEEHEGYEPFVVPCAHEPDRMGPLRNRAKEGRVNPRGIPCLYLSTRRDTAIAEVRPWIGSLVSVAQFEVIRDQNLINCTSDDPSFRIYFDEPGPTARETANWAAIDRAFARPVTVDDSVSGYEPTQILAELFKSEGFEGIAYRSSLGDGHNIALFDLDAAELHGCMLMSVDKVRLEVSQADNPYVVTRKRATSRIGGDGTAFGQADKGNEKHVPLRAQQRSPRPQRGK